MVVVATRPGFWPVLLSAMKLQTPDFIETHLESILPHLLELNADNQVWQPCHLSRLHRAPSMSHWSMSLLFICLFV